MYGGEHYVRINLATSREVLSEAMNRLKKFIAEL
jgi:bifunctional pyridoxal-dependent enzyme with beta-cystathionase and maltose regulon repressor activities